MWFQVKSKYTRTYFPLHLIVTALTFFLLGKYSTTILESKLDNKEVLIPLSHRNLCQAQMNKTIHITIQKNRKEGILSYCRAAGVPEPSGDSYLELIHNSKFNLNYLDIQKIGSTFMKQMFSVLRYGPTYAKENFSIPRDKVHKNLKGLRKKFLFNRNLDKTVTIVTVRNPYSRLFAAFVDKVYLPNSNNLVSDIIAYKHRRNRSGLSNLSGLSVTFLDFLNYALDPHERKKTLFDHYDPCFPRMKLLICNYKKYFVVKQETFESDIKSVLQLLDVDKKENETYSIIIKSLHESRVEDTIPGIVKVTFGHATENAKLWSVPNVAERLWKSFQMQGYVSNNVPFPKNHFNSELKYSNSSYISSVFINAMKEGRLSRNESMEQRQEAMISAYNGLPENVLRKIQDVYKCDFKAFGYNITVI